MASVTLRSAAIQPPITFHRRSADRKTTGRAVPATKPPKIRSILTPQRLRNRSPIFSHNLDDWVRESAPEIVRNLRRVPLLVRVNDGGEVETEQAAEEDWDAVEMRWREGGDPAGVMLVGEIGEEAEEERETRVWGILVQGKGTSRVGCYLLKTCRVGSGLGFGCTHFCLTPVRDFRESALSQLNSCWLMN